MARTSATYPGREFLAHQDPSPAGYRFVLPGRPRRAGVLRLDGRDVAVRYAERDGSVRIICDQILDVAPGTRASVDAMSVRLLFAIDSFDPSRRARVAKMLTAFQPAAPSDGDAETRYPNLAQRVRDAVARRPDRDIARPDVREELSPAARRALESIRTAWSMQRYEQTRRVALKEREDPRILDELDRSGAVAALAGGYLVDEASVREASRRLLSLGEAFGSRDAAAALGSSHGLAKALLDRLVRTGSARREDGRFRVLGAGHGER